jgi:ABC-type transport system substrate-binding protein
MSPPFGAWGLPDKEIKALPGYRAAAQDKAEAKRLLAAAGVSATTLKVDLVTRNFAIYIDLASFVVDRLKQVGIEAAVRQIDTAALFPTLARRELHRLLRRAGRPPHRRAISGARPREADADRPGHAAQARGRRGPADARLAQGIRHPVWLDK